MNAEEAELLKKPLPSAAFFLEHVFMILTTDHSAGDGSSSPVIAYT
jgi:hypothetical protein